MGGHRARRGFTLVEILVVIAIIAILAGIAYPVFKSVRLKANKTTCVHNLQQLGMALRLYAADHTDRYPIFRDSDDYSITHRFSHPVSGDWGRWGVPRPRQSSVHSYLAGDNQFFLGMASYTSSKSGDPSKPIALSDVWRCPEDHLEKPPGVEDEASLTDEEWQDLVDSGRKWMAGCSYIFNRSLSGQRTNCTTQYQNRPYSVGGKSYFSWPNGPSGTGIMCDADAFHVRDRRAHGGYVRANVGNNNEDPEYLARAPKPGRVFLFCDGHAKFIEIHDNEWPDSEDHANHKDGKNDDTYIWWKPAEEGRVYIWPTTDDWPYDYDKDIALP
jgi:prepilin-type N-terminal cleavage/methylation domain-containing protein/prepilin-type processing-associated H-X9-DG protein